MHINNLLSLYLSSVAERASMQLSAMIIVYVCEFIVMFNDLELKIPVFSS